MNTNCAECTRLFEQSASALKSHSALLGNIFKAHYEPAMLWKLEPDVLRARALYNGTKKAFDKHQAICN